MKYFTPTRYQRLGNLGDEKAFLTALRDWERAISRYKGRLQRIRDDLPSNLRRLIESVYLHDARVLGMCQGQVSRFTITLQPETTPGQLVVLAYSLVEPPRIERAALADLCNESSGMTDCSPVYLLFSPILRRVLSATVFRVRRRSVRLQVWRIVPSIPP
jgi:hypothetical protein